MAYYALLDDNYIVVQVITGKDESDTSHNWEQHYGDLLGGICKRTSYNTYGNVHYGPDKLPDEKPPYRKNYAGIGYTYDPQRDAFIPPRPYLSWVLNDITCIWDPPVPYPNDGQRYSWDETTQSWIEQ